MRVEKRFLRITEFWRVQALMMVLAVIFTLLPTAGFAALPSSTTALVSDTNPSATGQTVTFTATVTPAAATGTVTFMDGVTTLGTGTLSGGVATFSTSALSGGGHGITAVYGGGNYAGSQSSAVIQGVTGSSATSLSVDAAYSTYSQVRTFTATVTPAAATGMVTFLTGTTVLGSAALSGGVAALNTRALPSGASSVIATYADIFLTGSTSGAVAVTVYPSPFPALAVPGVEQIGANIATLVLQSSDYGTGYFTLQRGSNIPCGTGVQVMSGLTATGGKAPYIGYLPVNDAAASRYTVRTLGGSSSYTICFTAENSAGQLQEFPTTAGFTTQTAADLPNADWSVMGSFGPGHTSTGALSSPSQASHLRLAFAPDGTPYVSFLQPADCIPPFVGTATKCTVPYNRVMKFSDGQWSDVGQNLYLLTTTSGPQYYWTQYSTASLVFAPDGTLYMLQMVQDVIHPKVLKLEGDTWVDLGFYGSIYDKFALSLTISPDGVPYLYFTDIALGAKLYKFIAGAWQELSQPGWEAGGFYGDGSPFGDDNSSVLQFSPDGTLYLAAGAAGYTPMYLNQYDGSSWSTSSPAGWGNIFSGGDLAFSPDGSLYGLNTMMTTMGPIAYRYDGGGSFTDLALVAPTSSFWFVDGGAAAGCAVAPDATFYCGYETLDRNTVFKRYSGGQWSSVGSTLDAATYSDFNATAFAPDGTLWAVLSGSANGMVMRLGSTASVALGLSPVTGTTTYGQTVTFTATMTPAAATGTVLFRDGTTVLGSGPVVNGVVTFSTAGLAAGSHSLNAFYTPDSANRNRYSEVVSAPAVSLTVTTPTPAMTLVSSANPSSYWSRLDFTVTVAAGNDAPTGTVTLLDGATVIDSETLVNGTALFQTFSLDQGSHTITATYSGDSNYNSASITLQQTIAASLANGACGAANGQNFASAPAANLCNSGYASAVAGTGPWAWSCGGAYGGTNASCSAYIDATPPSLTLSTLADGSYTNNATLNVSGTASDASGIQSVVISSPTATTVTLSTSDNINYIFSYPVTLATGTNVITTVAVDKAGNTTTDTRTLVLDQTAPVLTITSPADNSVTGSPIVTVSGTMDTTATVLVSINSGPTMTAGVNATSFSLPVSLATNAINTIDVFATDLAGNTSSAKRTVMNDETNPSLAITAPNQDMGTNQTSITLSGTVSDLTNVSLVVNCPTASVGVLSTPTTTTWSVNIANLQTGVNTVTVKATNQAGNNTSVIRNIVYTAMPVTINAVTSPTTTNSQTVSGTREENATVTVNCSTATVGTVTYPSATTWQTLLTLMSQGNNAITITVTDAAGNTASPVSIAIVYDPYAGISGDINGGGIVDISDALAALRIAAGIDTPTSAELTRGDVAPLVNGKPQPDGKIDIGDVVVILRKVVGLISW